MEWWKSIGAPELVVAPMVDQSELAFRRLCRAHGAGLAVTPMLHARHFAERGYREANWSVDDGHREFDRPLLVQFAANDAAELLAASRHVEGACDGVDINLGCPERVAKKGRYGAFLVSC